MFEELRELIKGDVATDKEVLATYSRDASLIEITPQAVVFPKNSDDIQKIITWVNENKTRYPDLSITPRSAGTCMAGGAVNDSIILDVTRYMNTVKQVDDQKAVAEPGVYYRDFEPQTLERNRIMPAFTASKDICALGGMFGNNSGGEKTLKYGKVEDYILRTKTIFADGSEYVVEPLTKDQLDQKISQGDYEGNLYKQVYELIEANYDTIQAAKPNVSKNSAGYYLWNAWNREAGIFDLNKLLVGAQGTLGITTEITWKLLPVHDKDKMLVVFMDDISQLGGLVTEILEAKPDSLEAYDDDSMKLAVKFFRDFFKIMGFWGALKLGMRFLPEVWMMLRGGVPKLVLIAEFTGDDEGELTSKVHLLQDKIRHFGYQTRIPRSDADERKYWKIRHESFNMLRKHVQGMRTAPFIDDIIVNPEHLPEFLPKLQEILSEYDMIYTIAGHAGNGNFHIIPLMNMSEPKNVQIIDEVSDRVYKLVLEYDGSITAEHNDGIIRTPYLEQMFGKGVVDLFRKVKNIFDPENIFNPNKKVGATKEYMMKHLANHN